MADFVAKVADEIGEGGFLNVGAAVVAACSSRSGSCDALILTKIAEALRAIRI
jgi:hypothetical protein